MGIILHRYTTRSYYGYTMYTKTSYLNMWRGKYSAVRPDLVVPRVSTCIRIRMQSYRMVSIWHYCMYALANPEKR